MSSVIEQLQNSQNQFDDALNIKALVDAASFAWFSYGMMSMTNTMYYVNKFYWDYVIRSSANILAFRTWWGMSEMIRVFGNFATWGITLMFWAATFAPYSSTHKMFAMHATHMMYAHMIRLAIVLLMKILAFFMDSYTEEYQYYPYEIKMGGDDSSSAIDYSLELSTFMASLLPTLCSTTLSRTWTFSRTLKT